MYQPYIKMKIEEIDKRIVKLRKRYSKEMEGICYAQFGNLKDYREFQTIKSLTWHALMKAYNIRSKWQHSIIGPARIRRGFSSYLLAEGKSFHAYGGKVLLNKPIYVNSEESKKVRLEVFPIYVNKGKLKYKKYGKY